MESNYEYTSVYELKDARRAVSLSAHNQARRFNAKIKPKKKKKREFIKHKNKIILVKIGNY